MVCHTWLAQKDKLNSPDKVVFDLNPSVSNFEKVKQAAQMVGDYLREKKLRPTLMNSGKSGLHVYYWIRRIKNFDQVWKEVRDMAEDLVVHHPNLLTTETPKNKREDKVFVDYFRNAYAQTSVCSYSLRGNTSAGIATLLDWKELDKITSGEHYGLNNIFRRLGAKSSN